MIIKTLYLGVCMTNCYIVSGDGKHCVVIDPADNGIEIYEKINSLGWELEAVLLTHGHFDHIYGLPELINASGKDVPVYINENEYHFLTSTEYNLSGTLFGTPFICTVNEKKVADGDIISAAGLTFKVIHTPGHTPGSTCFVAGDSIFSGDTLFTSTIGRTDFPGGNYDALISSLQKLKALEGDYNIYPGHNASTTLSREKAYNEFMLI